MSENNRLLPNQLSNIHSDFNLFCDKCDKTNQILESTKIDVLTKYECLKLCTKPHAKKRKNIDSRVLKILKMFSLQQTN